MDYRVLASPTRLLRGALVGQRRSVVMVVVLLATALMVAACAGDEPELTDDPADTAPGGEPTETPEVEGAEPEDDTSDTDIEGEDDEPAAEPPEQSELTFGILPTPGYAPVVMAVEEGFFGDEGLEVDTPIMAPGSSVTGVVGGTYDIAGVNWITFLIASNSGVPLYPVAEGERGVPDYAHLLVRADSDAESLEDLVGRDVAVVATPGNCDLIPLGMLQDEGMEGSPNFVDLAIPDMPGALERGDVDAACVPEPLLGGLLASGDFRTVVDLFEGDYRGFAIAGYSSSLEFADDNPNTIAAVQRALTRSVERINDDPDALRAILPTFTNMTPEQAEAVVLPEFVAGFDGEVLHSTADLINRLDVVDTEIEVPEFE